MTGPNPSILTVSNTQAKALAGSRFTIGGVTYRFRSYDPSHPGQPPWRSGAEGKAFPLLAANGATAAYMKFFTRPTPKRLHRTAWLIGQQMHTWLPNLAGAPLVWADTRRGPRATKLGFDFAGYLAEAVPGETWLELKHRIVGRRMPLPDEVRWRCVEDLVLAAAVLEQAGIVHGDLSPNNIIIDQEAPADEPSLYLIDFDAFVAPAAGWGNALSAAEGGTYGTEGYCPPDLTARAGAGVGSVAPYSDRYARDMLLLELLLMDPSQSPDNPPDAWDRERLRLHFAACSARTAAECSQALAYLDPAVVFTLAEGQRPRSSDLALALGLALPEKPAVRSAAQPSHAIAALPLRGRGRGRVHRPIRQSAAVAPNLANPLPVLGPSPPTTHARFRKPKIPGISEDGTFWVAVVLGVALLIGLLVCGGLSSLLGLDVPENAPVERMPGVRQPNEWREAPGGAEKTPRGPEEFGG